MTLLHLNQVSLQFSNKRALNAINYEMQSGDFVILLGSNGSGKSSLIKLLHQHCQPTQGQIQFLGKPIASFSKKDLNRHIAVLTQNCDDALFLSLTVLENCLLKDPKLKRSFLTTYLADFNPRLSDKLDTLANHLSGGEKQALALALCLLIPPTLLLLDEHTSALDPKTSEQIMRITARKIQEHRITCLLITHDLGIASTYGNRILVLKEGKIDKAFDANKKSGISEEELLLNYYRY